MRGATGRGGEPAGVVATAAGTARGNLPLREREISAALCATCCRRQAEGVATAAGAPRAAPAHSGLPFELPYISKFLLAAAYIASRNKPTSDRQVRWAKALPGHVRSKGLPACWQHAQRGEAPCSATAASSPAWAAQDIAPLR